MAMNGTVRLIIYIVVSIVALIAALKAWILLPHDVSTQAAQSVERWENNSIEHKELEDNLEDLDDEVMATNMDVVEIKSNIRHIITEQDRQEKRQKERHDEILDEIKELHE